MLFSTQKPGMSRSQHNIPVLQGFITPEEAQSSPSAHGFGKVIFLYSLIKYKPTQTFLKRLSFRS